MNFVTPDLCDENPDDVIVAEPLFTNYGGKRCFSGQIVTVKCHEDNSRVKELASTNGTGKVMVVDGGGSLRCALLGDMIAEAAREHGWNGVIIYGCIRDVDEVGDTDIGVQALATIPLKSNRQGIGQVDVPVKFAGITFSPGQFIYADNNGIVVSEKELKL